MVVEGFPPRTSWLTASYRKKYRAVNARSSRHPALLHCPQLCQARDPDATQ